MKPVTKAVYSPWLKTKENLEVCVKVVVVYESVRVKNEENL